MLIGLLALLLMFPALPAESPTIEALGDQIATCLGREDPVCAEPLVADMQRQMADSVSAAYCRGVTDFLEGKFTEARTSLQKTAGDTHAPAALRERAQQYLDLTISTAEVLDGAKPHKILAGRVTVWLRPGADEVLLGYIEHVVGRTLPILEQAFGKVGDEPIAIHVYPRSEDLGRVSGLTVEQIRNSGTIALCKYNRVMITSPQDLVFGYAWADTVAHELTHWFVIKRGGPGVPVWLHEGLARSFEGVWRGRPAALLDRSERQALLAARVKKKFITLARMSPSMALLPTQEDTQLAFAEVHHAVGWLLAHGGVQESKAGRSADGQAGRLVSYFGAGLDENGALQKFSGLTPSVFAANWKKDMLAVDLREQNDPEQQLRKPEKLYFKSAGGTAAVLKSLGGDARKFAELGDRLAVAKRPFAAAIEYRKAMAAGQSDGPLLPTRLVRVLLDLNKPEEALDYLKPALEAWPEHAPLHILAGRAHLAAGKFREALESLERAAWFNPFDPQLHDLAAQAYDALGEAHDAAAARVRQKQVAAGM
jgi:tetratricopeptide (TPR) repeat protein